MNTSDIIYLKRILLVVLLFCNSNTYAQEDSRNKQLQTAYFLFDKVKHICDKDNGQLWGENLISPMILINVKTRFFVATDSLPIEHCNRKKNLFVGCLPIEYPVSNTTLNVKQKTFASVRYSDMKPIDTTLFLRTFIHELFHVFSDSILGNEIGYNNEHIDTKDGRTYLQMELLALKDALTTQGNVQKEAITRALFYRKKRQSINVNSKQNENNFEIQEGLAVYTEYTLGMTSVDEHLLSLQKDIDQILHNDSYFQSFGYTTGACYAFLNEKSTTWKKSIFIYKDISRMTQWIYQIDSINLDTILVEYTKKPEFKKISMREDSLENQKIIENSKIIEKLNTSRLFMVKIGDHLFSGFVPNMRQMVGVGTYYPNMKLSGQFGTIESQKECVMKWKEDTCFFILDEIMIDNNQSNSDKLKIMLNEGWEIEQNGRIYRLVCSKSDNTETFYKDSSLKTLKSF